MYTPTKQQIKRAAEYYESIESYEERDRLQKRFGQMGMPDREDMFYKWLVKELGYINPEVKDKWLKALRSGEYKQGKGALKTNDDKFCCLGVLCDLYQKEHEEAKWVDSTDKNLSEGTNKDLFEDGHGSVRAGIPTDAVIRWAGMKEPNPKVGSFGGSTLAKLNDNGSTFDEIADLIEKYL